jgi:hypothetical protein
LKRITAVALIILFLASCHVETVDQGQAVAVASKFYSSLQSLDVKAALALFSPVFKNNQPNWPRLLAGLQDRNGAVTSAALNQSSLAAQKDVPCYLLTYSVKRGTLPTDEKLFICRDQQGNSWSIYGHELTRLDTNQSISGGVMPTEVGVHVP